MATHDTHHAPEHEDVADSIVHAIPIVLPAVGGVLMFLLAAIAIYLA